MNSDSPDSIPHSAPAVALHCAAGGHDRHWRAAWLFLVFSGIVIAECHAIPFYARSRNLSCTDCHAGPPKLNAKGEEFLARGYRRSTSGPETAGEFPISVWITGRHEDRTPGSLEKTFVPKVELISGGPVSNLPLSYFVEWRVVSLDVRNNGSLRDRGGRFEDALINFEAGEHTLRVGQFRALNQYDVSLRLSASEPAIFSTALPGAAARDPRITGLRGFSPSGRSPGAAYTFQSMKGTAASDGLFHTITVPFVGELSLPLSDEARREASFELEGPAKGVFLETFYRRRLNSIGAHAFIDEDRWLATAVGRTQHGNFYVTAAAGLEDAPRRATRTRYSFEVEHIWPAIQRVTPAIGFRLEHITRAGRDPAYIPYLAISGPNSHYTMLLQVEGRFQGSARTVLVDLSLLF